MLPENSEEEITVSFIKVGDFCGIEFYGKQSVEEFYKIICPCGITVTYPLNGIPEVDTLHPCGNPNHWSIKYK